ncbi:MAG: hypothetical protein IJ247_07160 [Bacilli bacterium]|nr:hypothetical protein [Bacilli bacterium]
MQENKYLFVVVYSEDDGNKAAKTKEIKKTLRIEEDNFELIYCKDSNEKTIESILESIKRKELGL